MRKDSATLNQSQMMMFDGWDESTSSAADLPVSRCHLPAKEKHKMTRGGCGRKPCKLLMSQDPLGASLRIHLASELKALTGFLTVWNQWDTPAGHMLFRLMLPDLDNTVSESGLWPTPTATDCYGYKTKNRKWVGGGTLRLNHWLYVNGREDLAHSWRFGAKLMGWPEDFRQRLETHCLEWLATAGVIQSR